MSDTPTYSGFEEYSEHIPASIPAAVQQATGRFVSGRAARVAELPEWEHLRQAGSDIRLHTIEYMDVYLAQFEEKVKAAGGHVHWAATAEEANRIVLRIAQEHNVNTAVKSKSMATEEIELNEALEHAGVSEVETDLGEFVVQLAADRPSHIITPIIHRSRQDVATLFRDKLGATAADVADIPAMTAFARRVLRAEFLQAGMGIEKLLALLVAKATKAQETGIGDATLVFRAILFSHHLDQAFHCPKLTVHAAGVCSKRSFGVY